MKIKIFLIAILVLSTQSIFSQVENLNSVGVRTLIPFFYFNALNFKGDDPNHTRVDLYIQVPYTQLSFVKEGDFFVAMYEVTAGVYDSTERLVTEKIWTEKIVLGSYSESVSRNGSNISSRSFRLVPGNYKLKVAVQDKESKKNASATTDLNVRAFREAFAISDILLVTKYSEIDSRKEVIPNITNNIIFSQGGFYLFFEFYNQSPDSNFNLNCKINNSKGKTIFEFSTPYRLTSLRNPIFLKVEKSDFSIGEYILTITAKSLDTIVRGSYSVSKRVFSRWVGVPRSIVDLNKAIEQMIYITNRDKINELLKIEDEQTKYEKFMDFWKSKDPTPGTEENELMDEYYGRVDYANQHFSTYQEGWKTDMGMVFIILGPPNNVERRPFNYDRPAYEIWEYYTLNRSFVFVDYTGFGDYRLLNRDFSEWFKYR
ncbi:MAG: GWxTD domain-containing protein [Ignavibacteria bacterium]|nr:GWxTD domain-containing protein [Ignavibacteria bacterium]